MGNRSTRILNAMALHDGEIGMGGLVKRADAGNAEVKDRIAWHLERMTPKMRAHWLRLADEYGI